MNEVGEKEGSIPVFLTTKLTIEISYEKNFSKKVRGAKLYIGIVEGNRSNEVEMRLNVYIKKCGFVSLVNLVDNNNMPTNE